MPVPVVYRKTKQRNLATYDAIDFIEQTGVVEFYGSATSISGATTYKLIRNQLWAPASNTIAGAGVQAYNSEYLATTSGSYQQIMDRDFDTSTFNQLTIIRGNLIANIPFSTNYNNGSVLGGIYVNVEAIKVDVNNTETSIASSNSNQALTSASQSYGDGSYFCVPVTIPLTKFKKGEKLRVTIKAYVRADATGGSIGGLITYDAGSRAVYNTINKGAGYTRLSIYVPFKIDL